MNTRYVDLVDYLAIATEVTGLHPQTVAKVTKVDLADSALHAPQAGFGDTEKAVLAVASGDWSEEEMTHWLRSQFAPPDE